MKILMLAQNRLSRKLGGPKVVMELGEALGELDCAVTVLGTDDVARSLGKAPSVDGGVIAAQFDHYLREHAASFDVIDYDHGHLPFPRSRYCATTLMVARSVLLTQHLRHMRGFEDPRALRRLARALRWRKYRGRQRRSLERAEATLRQADLINVSNRDDVDLLTGRCQLPHDRVVEIPLGIPTKLAGKLNRIESPPAGAASIVFVGTFDFRKGCLDLPRILSAVRRVVPHATLTILGAKGLFQTEERIRKFFRRDDQGALRVVMSYEPETLPLLMQGHSVGVFPSYLEGFGIGIVEMLAAGLPVFAYASPGPRSILPERQCVAAGDWYQLSVRISDFLKSSVTLREREREQARAAASHLTWAHIAETTIAAYTRHLERLRARAACRSVDGSTCASHE